MKQLLFISLLALFSTFANALSYTLELTESELQAKAEAMMPLKKTKYFITATLTKPMIDLMDETNEIQLTSNVKISALGSFSGNGKVSFSGSLRYVNESGAFYFDNLKINTLEIDEVPAKTLPKVKKVLEVISKKVLSKTPVYKFKDDDLKQKLAKSALKSITIKNDTLVVELSVF